MIKSAIELIDAYQEAQLATTDAEKEAAAKRLVKAEIAHNEKLGLERKPTSRFRRILQFIIPLALIILVVGTSVQVVRYAVEAKDNSDAVEALTRDLQNSVVEGCEKNGNLVREVIRKQINKDIRDTDNINPVEFFPNVPPETIEQLLQEGREDQEVEIKELAPVDCEALYRNQPDRQLR